MDKNFKIEVLGMGINAAGYPGAFTPIVNKIIMNVIPQGAKTINLFSGISMIGEERIDIERPEATCRMDVIKFIETDNRKWDFVILDPPYEIKNSKKLEQYGRTSSVAADVMLRRKLVEYFNRCTNNILWLDMCAPLPENFKRIKLWFLFPGGYHTIRILSLLKRIK